MRTVVPFGLVAQVWLTVPLVAQQSAPGEWASYGRDPGMSRYSPLTQITRDNVAQLRMAWTFRTGETGPAPETLYQSLIPFSSAVNSPLSRLRRDRTGPQLPG